MKKIISFILTVFLAFSVCGCGYGKEQTKTLKGEYITVKIPFPKEIKDNESWRTHARFKDTKEPIALSTFYNDSVYSTIPVEHEGREIEAFVPVDIEFSDYDPSRYEFHDMEVLARTGVIKGDENGAARPFEKITRAEAVAMIMRFIGRENIPPKAKDISFADVLETDWFYGVVASAYENGIAQGTSKKAFEPAGNVTREEITVMISRALKYAGLNSYGYSNINYVDKDKISSWAKEAYDFVRFAPSDYDDTDVENPVRVLNPQNFATRYDVAYTLSNTARTSQLYASDLAIKYGFDKEMPTIDGSTSTYPFTEAVYTTLFCNGPAHVQFPASHSKSHASYESLINGEVDMLFASVYPASDILEMAEKKGVELELIPIAYDAMIFFTNASNSSAGLTKEQITDIYVNNAYKNWNEVGGEDALMYPYCRNNDSGSHAQMEKHFLGGKEIHPEVQKETSMTMSNVLTDVMNAKTDEPLGYGLGYSIYYYFNNMDLFYNTKTELKLLEIDGVAPNDETIASGEYPLSNNTYIVLRKDTPEGAPARKMAEFMLTEEGQMCVEMAGYGKLKK